MKLASWNVNGLRACMNKGFLDSFAAINSDIFCLQEIKLLNFFIGRQLGEEDTYYSINPRKYKRC